MPNLLKNFILGIAVFLFLAAAFALLNPKYLETEQIKPSEVSLSEIAQKVEAGEVKKLELKGNLLTATLQDDTKAVATKEEAVPLIDNLKSLGVSEEALKNISLTVVSQDGGILGLLMPLSFILPLVFFLLFFGLIIRQAKKGAGQTFGFLKAPAKLFGDGKDDKKAEKITFDDIAGVEEAKEEIQEVVDFLKNPKKYLKMGARIPRGVLLVGAPGTGKTMLAKAVAHEAKVPFFSMAGSEFIELFVGVGASRTRALFGEAKKRQPSIIFIDEIDSIGKTRGVGMGGGHDEREQTLNQILAEMDGFERDAGVIVMAASITSETPVLIKQKGQNKLLPISQVIDPFYNENEEGVEKLADGLETLGFEKKLSKSLLLKNRIFFGTSSFKKVRAVFRHKVNEIFEVKYNGGTIRTTGNHSLFIRTRHGISAKPVSQMESGDVLVGLPYKANRTNKKEREIRAHRFNEVFSLELPVWQPLFNKFTMVEDGRQYALSCTETLSLERASSELGYDKSTIKRWQAGALPRALSRNYYKHKDLLPEKVNASPELMRLFGYYTAEGYSRKELDFCFNRKETDKIEDVINLIKNIFNISPDKIRYITPGAVNVIYFSKPLAVFFAYYCGSGASNKHVPDFLFEAPFLYFQEFFRGYFAGDGHSYKKRLGKGEVTSVSKKLILELNWLFRMHGFKSYVCNFHAKEGRVIYQGKPLKETLAWRLGFGASQNPLSEKNTRIRGSVCRPIVKSVKKMPYHGYVYDFCGCENEAFFAGESPILAHNTNRPEYLDPALLRPGRFDRRIVLDLPDSKGRTEILKIHCKGKPLAQATNLTEVAERTPGFSGADLANLANEAAILAARKNTETISQNDLLNSIEKVLLGPERKSHLLTIKEKEISAFHEAGHALLSSFLENAEEVRKVSIVSRGMAAGYTLALPKQEKRLKTKTEFKDELCVLLAGYLAEKMVFNELSTGASNDLEKASLLSRSLVVKYGMSKLGPIVFGKRETMPFLNWEEETTERNYSEKVAAQIDKETANFIEEAQERTLKILKQKRKTLDRIAKVLIEKETIEKDEFEHLMSLDVKPTKPKIKKIAEENTPSKKKTKKGASTRQIK